MPSSNTNGNGVISADGPQHSQHPMTTAPRGIEQGSRARASEAEAEARCAALEARLAFVTQEADAREERSTQAFHVQHGGKGGDDVKACAS